MTENREQKQHRSPEERRRARLAAQLRTNLGKRKAQARARAQGDEADPAEPTGNATPPEK